MGVCEPLMPDVVAPKAHQNNRSYVSSANLPLDSLCKNLAWWVVTQRTSKNHKTVKLGGGHLLGTIRYLQTVIEGLRSSLVPRPFPPPVFDRLQYAKMEGEGLRERVTYMMSGRHEGRR